MKNHSCCVSPHKKKKLQQQEGEEEEEGENALEWKGKDKGKQTVMALTVKFGVGEPVGRSFFGALIQTVAATWALIPP